MTQTRFSVTAGLCLTLAAAGCIGPQGAQPCAETADSAASDGDKAGGEEPLIEAVVPTGTLIWDGTSISNVGES